LPGLNFFREDALIGKVSDFLAEVSIMKKILIALSIAAFAFGCTKKSDSGGADSAAAINNNITIGAVGETMQFDKTELTVKSGEKVTLVFNNPSTTLKHNWVLTQAGKDNDVGLAGIKAGEANNFIPNADPEKGYVLAHTSLVDLKGTETITFTAPPPGDYPYICTNAGHHTVMKGTLHSK
jgi:azurin